MIAAGDKEIIRCGLRQRGMAYMYSNPEDGRGHYMPVIPDYYLQEGMYSHNTRHDHHSQVTPHMPHTQKSFEMGLKIAYFPF